MVRAILWDNDGVLVDSEHLYFEATRVGLTEVGVELTVELYREVNLREGRSCFDLARDAGVGEAELARLRAERDARFRERVRAGVELIDGVQAVLDELHGRQPMAIVTSSKRENLDAMHRAHAIDGYFDLVVANGDYARSKPDPEPYLTAAARLRVDPADCLVVEDSERGLRAAQGAGMRCLVVPNALTRGGDFSAAHRVLGSVRAVPEEVRALSGA